MKYYILLASFYFNIFVGIVGTILNEPIRNDQIYFLIGAGFLLMLENNERKTNDIQ